MSWQIDDGTPYRNVCEVEFREQGEAVEVAFAADPHGGPEALWFCFRLRPDGPPGGALRLVLKHAETMLGCGWPDGLRPVVRTPAADWERLPAPVVRDLPDGRTEWCWDLAPTGDWLDVALCYPYGPPEVDHLLSRSAGRLSCDSIGVSHAARPILRLANDFGGEATGRPGVYCVGRQHSGEVSGSWALDGFLERICELGDAAPLVWAVPLSNIDGVEQGDYGKDNYPYDLNRAWEPLMRHETLVIARDIHRWRRRCEPVMVLDWHAPGGTESDGIYTFGPDPAEAPQQAAQAVPWITVCGDALGTLGAERFSRVANYRSRWETLSLGRWSRSRLELPSLTFEVSYELSRAGVLTRELYQEAGRRLADAVTRLATGAY